MWRQYVQYCPWVHGHFFFIQAHFTFLLSTKKKSLFPNRKASSSEFHALWHTQTKTSPKIIKKSFKNDHKRHFLKHKGRFRTKTIPDFFLRSKYLQNNYFINFLLEKCAPSISSHILFVFDHKKKNSISARANTNVRIA